MKHLCGQYMLKVFIYECLFDQVSWPGQPHERRFGYVCLPSKQWFSVQLCVLPYLLSRTDVSVSLCREIGDRLTGSEPDLA